MDIRRIAARAWGTSPLWEAVEVNVDMINYVWGRVFRDIDITQGLAAFDRPVFLALGLSVPVENSPGAK